MHRTQRFDYEAFLRMHGDGLFSDEMRTLLYDDSLLVQEDDLRRMLLDLGSKDAPHTVFAIEFGMYRNPRLFAPRVPEFLRHQDESVRVAAARKLFQLPQEILDEQLVDAVKRSIALLPETERNAKGYLLVHLEDRLRRGDREES